MPLGPWLLRACSLWSNYRDESSDPITDLESFRFKENITGSSPNDNGRNKYKSNMV